MRRQPKTAKGRTISARVDALEREVSELREALARVKQPQRIRRGDPVKLDRDVLISKLKAQGMNDRYIALALDNSEFEPLASWTKATGLRLWSELYRARRHGFPLIQRTVRKYIRIVPAFPVTRPATSSDGKGKRKPA